MQLVRFPLDIRELDGQSRDHLSDRYMLVLRYLLEDRVCLVRQHNTDLLAAPLGCLSLSSTGSLSGHLCPFLPGRFCIIY